MTVATDPRKTGISAPASLLAASAVAVSLTGTLVETVLATVPIPAGAMGLNGGIEIRTVWTVTNSANNKALRERIGGIGGATVLSSGQTTVVQVSDVRRIRNRNSQSSQLVSNAQAIVGGTGASTNATTTTAVDMSVSQDLVFTGQLALASETITLESYEVWLLP